MQIENKIVVDHVSGDKHGIASGPYNTLSTRRLLVKIVTRINRKDWSDKLAG